MSLNPVVGLGTFFSGVESLESRSTITTSSSDNPFLSYAIKDSSQENPAKSSKRSFWTGSSFAFRVMVSKTAVLIELHEVTLRDGHVSQVLQFVEFDESGQLFVI